MIFSIAKSLLANAVSLVAPVTSKSTLPILDYITIRTIDSEHIELYATNMAQFVKMIVRADVSEFGSVALWGRGLIDLLALLPDARLELQSSERTFRAEIKCGKHKSSLPGVDPIDAPLFPSADGLQLFEISPSHLIDMLAGVVGCVGDDGRPTLSGVKISNVDGQFSAIATNGYHLGVSRLAGSVHDFEMLVPASSAKVLKNLLQHAGKVQVSIGDTISGFSLHCGDDIQAIAFASSLISGNYPDVAAIVPARHSTEVEIEIEPFVKALKSAKMFITSKTHDGLLVRVEPPNPDIGNIDGRLLLFAHGDEGDFTAEIPSVVSGGALALHASCKYMHEAADACPTERMILTGTTHTKPIVFTAAADCPVDWFHLIMPIDPRG